MYPFHMPSHSPPNLGPPESDMPSPEPNEWENDLVMPSDSEEIGSP